MSKIDPSIQSEILQSVAGQIINGDDNIISIKKYQYIFGVREIEVGFSIYKPTGLYSSPKYLTNATVTDIQLQVDDYHIGFQDYISPYYKTSIEYEV